MSLSTLSEYFPREKNEVPSLFFVESVVVSLGYDRAGDTLDHLNDNHDDALALLEANEDFDQLSSFIHQDKYFYWNKLS